MLGFTLIDDVRKLSDEAILQRSQSEPWLFSALLDRYQDAFLRKARSIIFSELDAEEVVQDTFTKIYMNAHRFEVREGAKFSSWAYTILVNTALTRYHKCVKEGKRVVLLDPEYEDMLPDTAATLYLEQHDGVARILEKIPSHFARVLRLHYLERWSHKDIAKESGESVGAVKARIHRAKAYFRKESKNEQAEASLF
ncbi:RNA polymerase sigma factor [Candidatus Kaiserbacteria bacterium]|nr:RNA polymerase sigma factor [Candidatus Kaiserbacteria bacterium]